MIPSLGSDFPLSYRRDFFKRNFKRGVVLRLHTHLTKPPKIKRFVVWGVDKNKGLAGISFINTEINPGAFKSNALANSQMFLNKSGRKYINHDSYLDCSSIIEESFEEIKKNMVEDPSVLIGQLTEEDMSSATNRVISAKSVEIKLKRRYGFIR